MGAMINFCGNCGERVCDHMKNHIANMQIEIDLLRAELEQLGKDKEANDRAYIKIAAESNSLRERHKWLNDFYVGMYKSSAHPECFGSLPNIQQQAENDCIRCSSKRECFK